MKDEDRYSMTKERLDGLYMMLLGCAVLLLLGGALSVNSSFSTLDFKVVYYPARCLLQHFDPYQEAQVMQVYRAEGGENASEGDKERKIATRYIYLPTAFFFTVPFALLPWTAAQLLWMTLTLGSLILAAFLMWNLAATSSPILAGLLLGFFLANSEVLVVTGNPAAIAVGFCVVAVWCFLQERFLWAGILLFAVSLALKPHVTGLVWLYFLLAGGVYRRRALQTLMAFLVLALPVVVWTWRVAPHWMTELSSNLAAFSVPGGVNDPGIHSAGSHGLAGFINLQTVFSYFKDDPRFYNFASYLLFGLLLLLWIVVTLRSRPSPRSAWLALAAIAPLSMLPVYHRAYDAKLLLLMVPACFLLWAEGGRTGRIALGATIAGIVVTGDLTGTIFIGILGHLPLPQTEFFRQFVVAMQVFPTPITLLGVGIFYLWVYAGNGSANSQRLSLEDRKAS
jgi:hypothetical protein